MRYRGTDSFDRIDDGGRVCIEKFCIADRRAIGFVSGRDIRRRFRQKL